LITEHVDLLSISVKKPIAGVLRDLLKLSIKNFYIDDMETKKL